MQLHRPSPLTGAAGGSGANDAVDAAFRGVWASLQCFAMINFSRCVALLAILFFTLPLHAADEPTFHLDFEQPSESGELVDGYEGKAMSLTGKTLRFEPQGNVNPQRGTINLQLLDLDFNGKFANQQRSILRIRSSAYYLELMAQNRYLYWRMYISPDKFPVKDTAGDKLYKLILSPRGQFEVGKWSNIAVSWDVEARTLRLAVNGVESPPITFDMIEGHNPMQVLIDHPPKDATIGGDGDSMFVVDELNIYDTVRDELFKPAGGLRDDATDHGSRVGRDWKPSMEVESAHVKWHRPLPGGKLKVLVVQPWENLRESVELAQRLDAELDILPVTTFERRCDGDGPMHPYEREDFLAKVKTNDVIVLAGVTPMWLDDDCWAALLGAVDEGKGVVWTIAKLFDHPRLNELVEAKTDTPAYLKRGVPYNNLIMWQQPDSEFTFIERGKGRMVLLNCNSHLFTRYTSMTPIYYTHDGEHYYALLARMAVWSAHREPQVGVEVARDLGFEAGKPQNWSQQKVTIDVPAAASGGAGRIELTVRDVTHTWHYERGRYTKPGIRRPGTGSYPTRHQTSQPLTLTQGTIEVACDFPQLPGGRYTLDAQLYDADGNTIDWDSALVIVDATPRLIEVAPEKPAYAPGETAAMVHHFQRIENAPPAELRWRVVDVYDRELANGVATYNGQETQTVSFTVPENFTKGLYYEITSHRDGEPLQTMRAMFLLPSRRDKTFYYGIYGALRERLGDLGVDLLFGGDARSNDALVEFDTDIIYWVNAPGLTVEQKPGDTVRKPSLSSAEWRADIDTFMEKHGPHFAYQKGVAGIVVDEWEYAGFREADPYHDLDHHPESVAAFRAFLKQEYNGSLGDLNATWGTQYASWDDVVMMLNKDIDYKTNPAPGVDRMRFIESVVADAYAYINDVARKYDPELRLGLSGTRPAKGYNGYDYYKILTSNADAIINYGGPMPAQSRSFAAPHDFTATWQGYGSNFRPTAGAQVWRAFIVGHDAYINYCTYPTRGMHHVDWTLTGGAAPRRDIYRELNSGIAELVRAGTRGRDAFAIHYSQASVHMLPLSVAGISEKEFLANLDSLEKLLEDSGIEPRYVATEQINAGKLNDLGVKVLYLPLSTAIGDDEARQIEAFVRGGGTIIADALCGLRDRHGRPRETGALDHLFNITRKGEPTYIAKLGKLDGDTSAIVGEWNLTAPGAAHALTLGNNTAPAMIERAVGRGRAMLLNFTFADYNVVQPGGVGGELDIITRAKTDRRHEAQAQFRALLSTSGIEPAIRVDATPNDQGLRLETLTARHTDGDALYALVQAVHVDAFNLDDRATNAAVVHLPKRGHVYDIRAGKYLGHTDRVDVTLTEGDAHVLAVLPRKASNLSLDVDRPRVAPGQTLRYNITVDSSARSIAHVTVTGPDGQPRPAYTANVETSGAIPLALNDAPGAWRINARDVATGLTTSATFQVQ